MTTEQITVPFPIFTDNNGEPLDQGKIYIGVEGTNPKTNPKAVFFDIDLNIPAAQPIQTINGYPVYDSTPAALFVDGTYSITVDDKNDNFLYISLSEGAGGGAIVTGDITSSGKIDLPTDGTALNAAGSINFGTGLAGVLDAGMFFDGSDLQIQTKGAGAQNIILDAESDIVQVKGSGALLSTIDQTGITLEAAQSFSIGVDNVLNTTTLGPTVVNSSLTSVGSLTDLDVVGPVTMGDTLDITGDTGVTGDLNVLQQVNSDGQSRIFANAVGQGMPQSVETLISWQSPSVNVGTSITVPSATKFVFASSGGYLVTLQTIMSDSGTQIRGRIRHYDSTPTFIRAYHNFTAPSGVTNLNNPSQLVFSVVIFANQDDEIDTTITRYDPDSGLTSSSTISIVKIF